jgi:hypothetical protein
MNSELLMILLLIVLLLENTLERQVYFTLIVLVAVWNCSTQSQTVGNPVYDPNVSTTIELY